MIYIYTINNKHKDSKLCIILLALQATLVGHHLCLPRFFQQCVALSTTMTDESVETSIIVLLGDKQMRFLYVTQTNPIKILSKPIVKCLGF